MKKIIIMVAFCLLSLALFAQIESVLRLQDAIDLYENDEAETDDGDRIIEVIGDLVAEGIDARTSNPDPEYGYDYSYYRDYTPLMYASMGGYTEIVKSLIASGAEVNAEGGYVVNTSLLLAAWYGHTEIVKLLIDAGADLEARERHPDMYFTSDGYPTALMDAARGGHTEIVKALIAGGADIDATSAKNYTALMYAAGGGRIEVVKALIDADADLEIESGTVDGCGNETALMDAVKGGHTEVVKLLLSAGANLEAQDTSGYTALLRAARVGQTEVVKILIAAGADLEAQSNSSVHEGSDGNTALMVAAHQGHTDVVNLLKEAGGEKRAIESIEELIAKGINATTDDNDYTPLMLASIYGYTDIVKSLIAGGANIEAKNQDSSIASSNFFTALILAAKAGQTEVMKILIDAGANLDATAKFYRTALTMAITSGKTEAVKILIGAGADLEVSVKYGGTALSQAAEMGRTEAVELLIDAGANLEAKGDAGRTALIWAAEMGRTEATELLIEAGANIEAQSNYGTALSLAARYGHAGVIKALAKAGVNIGADDFFLAVDEGETETVKALAEVGADIEKKDGYGRTVLVTAAADGHTEIVKALIEAGANLEASYDNETALEWAAYGGHTKTVRILIEAGANIDKNNGSSPLNRAIEAGHTGVAKALVAAGANLEVESFFGTALIEATEVGHTGMVRALIEAGANLEAKNIYGRTALESATQDGHTEIVSLLTKATQASYTVINGAGHNYYEIPYAGETSVLTKRIGDAKNKLIEKYKFPVTVNNFLNDGSSITGKLVSVYREDIPNKNGKTALSVYRLMYALSTSDSNEITKLSFIESEGIERQSYGQAIYTLNSDETKAELFSRDIYFGNQDLSGTDSLDVIGNNTYFKVINDTVISVLYTLQSSTNQNDSNHEAILYRNKIENIQNKTEFCKIKASFPLIDKNNPYRYTIQNALDGNPATSFVEDTEDDLMSIRFDFSTDHTFTDISIINGYAQSENLYYFNNRVKRINFSEISTNYEQIYNLDGNTLAHQEFTFENSITQPSATIDVTEIYKDTKYSDTCLAELDIYIEDEGWLFGLK